MKTLGDVLLAELRARFGTYWTMADRALGQVDDAGFFAFLVRADGSTDEENNPLALQVKHVAGNLRSRWTDFLTTDGDKPDRQRDREFELVEEDTRDALMAAWAEGWGRLEETLAALTPDDLFKTITIRGEPHTVLEAISRALAHIAYHVGQIVLLAKHHAGAGWQTLSVPRGQSEAFGAALRDRYATDAAPPAP